jgi:hypothetical protein
MCTLPSTLPRPPDSEQHGFTLIAFESASEQNTHGRSYWLRKMSLKNITSSTPFSRGL